MKIFPVKFLEFWVLEIGVWISWCKRCETQNLSNFFSLLSQNPSFFFYWFEGDCNSPILHH